MSEKLTALLEGLEREPIDAGAVSDLRHPQIVTEEVEALRLWLGIPASGTGAAISAETLAVLLGFGVEGVLRLHAAYAQETARTEQEAAASFEALRILARQARAMRVIDWHLDGLDIKPYTPAGRKLLVELEPALDERLRDTAKKRGETLRQFTEEAIRDRLALIDAPKRKRAEAASA